MANPVGNCIQKKVMLLGAAGVGKTSLVRRFVASVFDEKYLTTLGVKVDKKSVALGAQEVLLLLWDIAGPEPPFAIPASYLRGAAGFLLVVDGTRPETLEEAFGLVAQVDRELGPRPCVVVLNKADRREDWCVAEDALEPFRARGWPCARTSARTGEGVEDAFFALAKAVVAH